MGSGERVSGAAGRVGRTACTTPLAWLTGPAHAHPGAVSPRTAAELSPQRAAAALAPAPSPHLPAELLRLPATRAGQVLRPSPTQCTSRGPHLLENLKLFVAHLGPPLVVKRAQRLEEVLLHLAHGAVLDALATRIDGAVVARDVGALILAGHQGGGLLLALGRPQRAQRSRARAGHTAELAGGGPREALQARLELHRGVGAKGVGGSGSGMAENTYTKKNPTGPTVGSSSTGPAFRPCRVARMMRSRVAAAAQVGRGGLRQARIGRHGAQRWRGSGAGSRDAARGSPGRHASTARGSPVGACATPPPRSARSGASGRPGVRWSGVDGAEAIACPLQRPHQGRTS